MRAECSYIPTFIHTQTNPRTLKLMTNRTQSHTSAYKHTYVQTEGHTYAHAYTCMHTDSFPAQIHQQTSTRTFKLKSTHKRIHMQNTQIRSQHKYINTHAHIR
jgi:hypothetical protein